MPKHDGRGPRQGPAPVPTKLRVLEGSASPDREAREPRPDPSARAPAKPAWLKGEGASLWRKLAPTLYAKGLLDAWSAPMLAVLCNEYGDYVDAAKLVNDTAVLAVGHRNVLRKNPALTVQRDAVPSIRLLAAEFGLTPASRVGLDLLNELPVDDEVRSLLSGG